MRRRPSHQIPTLLTSRWRFGTLVLLWAALSIGASAALGFLRAFVVGFDVGASLFIVLTVLMMRGASPARMRSSAAGADANRIVLLLVAGLVIAAIMAALTFELIEQSGRDSIAMMLIIATLPIAWLFSNFVYAVHYAHLYYSAAETGDGDRGGIDFPGTHQPDYWDFSYFAMTLGMTFQTSDAAITSRKMRRVALGQSLLAFAFNLGVVALSVNVLAGR